MPHDHVKIATAPATDTGLIVQQELLEAASIACYLHREDGAASSLRCHLIPQQYLVIVHVEDLPRAQELLADYRENAAQPPGADWRCEQCGEPSAATFTSCWKCGAERERW